jgi:hypothetical protein
VTDEASTLVVAFDLAFEVDDDMGLDVAVVVEEAQRPIAFMDRVYEITFYFVSFRDLHSLRFFGGNRYT